MFAHRIPFDVFDNDHFLAVGIEYGTIENLTEGVVISLSEKFHRFGGSFRSFQQAFAFRIFTNFLDYFFKFVIHKALKSYG